MQMIVKTLAVSALVLLAGCRGGKDSPRTPGSELQSDEPSTLNQTAVDSKPLPVPGLPTDPAAVAPEAPMKENLKQLMALDVHVKCAQSAFDPAFPGSSLTVTCAALTADDSPFDASKAGFETELKWNFFHVLANKEYFPAISLTGDAASSPASKADFKFPLPYYFPEHILMIDTGIFRFVISDKNDPSATRIVLPESLSLQGQGCGDKDKISFTVNYPITTGTITRISSFSNDHYVAAGNGRYTTDSTDNFIVVIESARGTDRGSRGLHVVLGEGQLTAPNPSKVYAEKTATVNAPAEKVFYYRSPIQYCK